jgi:hypothetical protein
MYSSMYQQMGDIVVQLLEHPLMRGLRLALQIQMHPEILDGLHIWEDWTTDWIPVQVMYH